MTVGYGFESRPAEQDAAREAGWLFSAIRSLTPSSGLHFIDLELPCDQLPLIQHCFFEHRIEGERERHVLLPVQRDAREPGVAWHPVTFARLGPDQCLWLNGYDGLEPFLDTWVPVPYLRYLRRDNSGRPVFDWGPTNWVRAHVSSPPDGLRDADRLRVTLAIDSRIDEAAHAEATAPGETDVRNGSTFVFCDDPEDVGRFVGEPWIDLWLRESLKAYARRRAASSDGDPLAHAALHRLEHTARYLCFLKVLRQSGVMPQLRFVNVFDTGSAPPVRGVDMVLDIRCNETSALLVDRKGGAVAAELACAQMLRIRDLSNPSIVHDGPHPTIVEFDQQPFGSIAASRASGRTNAFYWPSIARIGEEAVRLSQRPNAIQGITGLAGLKACLTHTAAGAQVWRFSGGEEPDVDKTRMVFGEALSRVTEDGRVIGAAAGAAAPAIRPRFSPSSLLSFFAAELVLHALGQIHAPASLSSTPLPEGRRELQRIFVTADVSMPEEERLLLMERIQGGVDLVWAALGWEGETGPMARPKPQVRFGLGSDLGAHLVFLFDEVRSRFGGDFASFFDLAGAPATAPGDERSLRIASVELGGTTSSLTVVNYDFSGEESVHPALVFTERRPVGRELLARALAERIILPAVEAHLAACGFTGQGGLRGSSLAKPSSGGLSAESRLAARLDHLVIKPACAGLLELLEEVPSSAGAWTFSLGDLAAAGGGRPELLAEEFDAAAVSAGAKGFVLGQVPVRFDRSTIAGIVTTVLEPALTRFSDAAKTCGCDIVLLGGEGARLPEVADCLSKLMPVAPHRVLRERAREGSIVELPVGAAVKRQPQVMVGLVSAYMASREPFGASEFDLITAGISQSLLPSSDRAGAASSSAEIGPQTERRLANEGDRAASATAGKGPARRRIVASGRDR